MASEELSLSGTDVKYVISGKAYRNYASMLLKCPHIFQSEHRIHLHECPLRGCLCILVSHTLEKNPLDINVAQKGNLDHVLQIKCVY